MLAIWFHTQICIPAFLSSCQRLSLREEARGGGGGETGGAEAGRCGHRWDEGANVWADKALLQPGGGHDSAATQTTGLCLCAGKSDAQAGQREK